MGSGFKFMPSWPDALGYVLGLFLIWLIYLSVKPVVSFLQAPDSALGRLNENSSVKTAPAVSNPPLEAAELSESSIEILRRATSSGGRSSSKTPASSSWTTIEGINQKITQAQKALPAYIDDMLPDPDAKPSVTPSPRWDVKEYLKSTEEKEAASKKAADELEHFN